MEVKLAISKKEVEHIAWLARLFLTGAEKEKFQRELSKILDHASKIRELDTSKILPTSHILNLKNIFREDKAYASFPQEKVLANAPKIEEEAFAVPPIIGSEEK